MVSNSELVLRGSNTAKNGFKNEQDIADKFNNWNEDEDAKQWLKIMGYKLEEIERVEAVKVPGGYKPDIQVKITIYLKNLVSPENISIKLVSNPQGFNQIDKRWVAKYVELWNIPEDIELLLKKYTGEIVVPTEGLRDSRRMYLDEMDENSRTKLVKFFTDNKILVITDLIKGRGQMTADWMLVALKTKDNIKWILKNINEAMNIFGQGDVVVTEKGNLKIGRIGMQRKGGDNGRESANMLQFKINPILLFEETSQY